MTSPRPSGPGYCWRLGPTSWRLVPAEGAETWLAKFAGILELSPGPAPRSGEGEERTILFFPTRAFRPGENTSRIIDTIKELGLQGRDWRIRDIGSRRIWQHPGRTVFICEVPIDETDGQDIESMVQSLVLVYEQLIEDGGFPFHAALVERRGQAVALAASGGTGKSTCGRRIPRPWRTLCDDTSLVVPARGARFAAHPFATWSDYLLKRGRGTWPAGRALPLRAVFFLKQSGTDSASPLGQGEASIYITRSAHEVLAIFLLHLGPDRARALRRKLFDNACVLARALPAYVLELRQDGSFWKAIERVL